MSAAHDPLAPDWLIRVASDPAERPLRKVVILRTSRIGDFIVATPALRSLRAALPEAEFTFVGLPFLRDLVDRCPHLDQFVEFPGYPGMAEQFFDARAVNRFFAFIQGLEFDLAIQLNGSGAYSNPFALMLGARYTVGWIRPGEGAGRLDAALPWPELGHEIEKALSLPLFLGAPHRGLQREFPLFGSDRDAAEALLSGARSPLIGLHPAAREATKRWPPDRFAALAVKLLAQAGGTVVIVGGPEERELAVEVLSRVADRDRTAAKAVLDLTGRTTLSVLGAVIERLSVLVTNDSGPAHIAYALGTPAVTIFGGTDPARWGPPPEPFYRALWNPVPCWPCDLWVCPTHTECLQGIGVDRVVPAALEVMQ